MKREASMSACAVGVLMLSGCQTMPTADPVAEAQAIHALDAAWVQAIASKDAAKIAAFYSDDAVLLPPNEDAKSGDGIRKAWADTVGMQNVHLTFAPTRVEVDADGEMAIDVGTYELSFDSPGGKVEDHGKYAQVWEKHSGVWKCAVDMYNSSVPLPPPPAPPAAPAAAAPAPTAPAPAPKKKKK